MADKYLRVDQTLRVVRFVPVDEEHYPAMSAEEALRYENSATTEDRIEDLCETLVGVPKDNRHFVEKITIVPEWESKCRPSFLES